MSLLVFGSTALDSIITPKKKNPRLLGGSGSHAAVAASFFAAPKLIGVVGTDFPRKYISLLERHKVNLRGLKIREGKTFHWAGEYEVNMNNRRTLSTELGVVEGYSPVLPAAHRKAKYILLANNPPGAQEAIIEQLDKPKFVVADTMDLWMNIAMNDLLSLLKRVDMLVLNDSEARQLTGDENVVSALPKLHKLGPKYVIVKKGEHGSILSSRRGLFVAPAFPLAKVEDPTGAGDSFVGAMVGYLAKTGGSVRNGFLIGLVGVYLLLSFLFRNYWEPLIVMLAIPLGLIGVIWGHILLGLDLSMPSIVGFASLAGVVVNNAILLVHQTLHHIRVEGMAHADAVVEATRNRIRPIFMSTLTSVGGMLPLVLYSILWL